jgi:hypothetical protein
METSELAISFILKLGIPLVKWSCKNDIGSMGTVEFEVNIRSGIWGL